MAHDPPYVGEESHLLLVGSTTGLTWTVTFRNNNAVTLVTNTVVDNSDNTYDLQVTWPSAGDWVITAASSEGLTTRYPISVVPTTSTVAGTTGTGALKSNYLTLINKVLKRISQSTVTSIPSTGHAAIIAELLNEAQNYLYMEANWYSLYASRTWKTYQYTASTLTFNAAGTITDSANGLASFDAGSEILVSGTTNNDYVFTISTVAAGTLTLTSDAIVTSETPGTDVTLTQVTYPVASDYGKTLSIQDNSTNRMLVEDVIRMFDASDPDQNYTGTPTNFAVDGDFYRLFPMPAGENRYRENYIRVPGALSDVTDKSILPVECDNLMILYAYAHMLDYLQKYDVADRVRVELVRQLERAKSNNNKKIDQLHKVSQYHLPGDGIASPTLPSNYGRYGF